MSDESAPGPRTEAELIELIAAVVDIPEGFAPLAFEDASREELANLLASSWVNSGFTDAAIVRRWIDAGVQSSQAAADATRAGFRPTDPWVERGQPKFASPGIPLTAPSKPAAKRNRRAAARRFRTERRLAQQCSRTFERDMAAGASLMRQDVLQGVGDPDQFTILEMAALAGTVTESDVLGAADALLSATHRIRDEISVGGSADTEDEIEYWLPAGLVIRQHLPLVSPEVRPQLSLLIDAEISWLAAMKDEQA